MQLTQKINFDLSMLPTNEGSLTEDRVLELQRRGGDAHSQSTLTPLTKMNQLGERVPLTTQSVTANSRLVICKRSKPPPPTADATCIAIDDKTQHRYLCKDTSKVTWLPLAEWVTQSLAKKCELLVPDCFVVELEADPGIQMFGSRWEGGAEAYYPGIIGSVTNPKEFSAIYAFDLLIHNVDRHLNNYLYLQLAGDTVVKAMDHSRCLWQSGWPLPAPPTDAGSNTTLAKNTWSAEAGWDKTGALTVVEKWKKISQADVAAIIDSAPKAWVETLRRQELVDWWGTTDWEMRADLVAGVLP